MDERADGDPFEPKRLAKLACADPRTVDKYLRGVPIRSDARRRIRFVLKKLGVVFSKDPAKDP